MPLTPGTRLGVFLLAEPIGRGGMGEVYRARDTKLGRDVAIKVLPEAFVADPERVARFQREAKTLASLNHPNIAAIYGLEESGGVTALVMELVEGEDLSQRIARGAIPLDEALLIARQIADALEAGHEQHVIHRDLKPANVKVRADGVVKVLDYGLAKAMEPTGAMGVSASQAPTITSPALMTGADMILGTAAYMSPEQARGKTVDKRADIWAFGAVLYEMLSGTRPFEGDDLAETLGAVIHKEPAWSRVPTATPASVRTVLQRCLQKDPRQRLRDIGDVRLALEGAFETATLQTSVPVVAAQPAGWRRGAALTAGALVVAAVAGGAAVWVAMRLPESVPPPVARLAIAFGPATTFTVDPFYTALAITPDGFRVIYAGNRGTQLFVRTLDALEPVGVFTGAPRMPFVSPDGQWIGFVDNQTTLKKVTMTGGPAITLATIDGGARGAAWGPEDTVIFATSSAETGLQKVAAGGGLTTILTRPDRAQGEGDHIWPELLPGGRAALFTITALAGNLDEAQVAILDLQTGTRKILVRGGSHARYVSNGPGSPTGTERRGGYLVYAAAGALRAVAFDVARLETRGTSVPVVPDVAATAAGGVDAVVAGNGTLAYVAGTRADRRTLTWVDREGRETPIPAPPRAYVYPRLSPEGARVAVYALDREIDIWVWNLALSTLTRSTFEPGSDLNPVWTPDGRRLIFSSDRAGARNLFWQVAEGAGAVERLTESPNSQYPMDVSPDGRLLIFTEGAPKTSDDVMQVTLDSTRRVTPLVQSPFAERNGVVSPDGRWLAYEANESGRFEIYVRPFPAVNSGHWQVSTAGGTRPLWARNGQELFYVSPEGALLRVGVERGPSWAATTPTRLVKEGYLMSPSFNRGRTYDISPDGQRFLMIKEGSADGSAVSPSLIVVQHWTEELKRLVPTK